MVASPDGYPENCECLHEYAILDELNQVKADKNTEQERLAQLEKSKKTLQELQHAELKLRILLLY
jgi:hypothetical protein